MNSKGPLFNDQMTTMGTYNFPHVLTSELISDLTETLQRTCLVCCLLPSALFVLSNDTESKDADSSPENDNAISAYSKPDKHLK